MAYDYKDSEMFGEYNKREALTLEELHEIILNMKFNAEDLYDKAVTTEKIDDLAVTYAKIDQAAIGEVHIREASINQAMIQDLAVSRAKIALAAIGTAQIDQAAITSALIKDLAVTRAKIEDAAIGTAQIETGAITTALIENAAIGTTQIADGSITSAKIVELTANKITTGTLSVDRLLITGANSILYELNVNAVGEVEASETTLDGEGLTPRSITADKIVANAITANEIAAKTITANEMVLNTITAASGIIADAAITTAKIADLAVTSAKIQRLAAEKVTIGSDTVFDNGFDPTTKATPGDITNAIDDIEISTRNLARNFTSGLWNITASAIVDNSNKLTFSQSTDTTFVIADLYIPCEGNQEFTGSALITGNGRFELASVDGSKNVLDNHGSTNPNTIQTHVNAVELRVRLYTTLAGTSIFEDINITKSNKATPWTPAPEDNPALLWQYQDTTFIDGGKIYADTIVANAIKSGSFEGKTFTGGTFEGLSFFSESATGILEMTGDQIHLQEKAATVFGDILIDANGILMEHTEDGGVLVSSSVHITPALLETRNTDLDLYNAGVTFFGASASETRARLRTIGNPNTLILDQAAAFSVYPFTTFYSGVENLSDVNFREQAIMHKDIFIKGNNVYIDVPDTTGGHARGVKFRDNTGADVFELGMFGTAGSFGNAYLGAQYNNTHMRFSASSMTIDKKVTGTSDFEAITVGSSGINSAGYVETNAVDHNGVGSVLYLRPQAGSEVRATELGTTGTYVPVRASSFPTGSMAEFKQDIIPHNGSFLDVINSATLYDYRLINEWKNGVDKVRTGLVIGEGYSTPEEVIDGDGTEQYLMNSYSWGGIQELYGMLLQAYDRIEVLENKLLGSVT